MGEKILAEVSGILLYCAFFVYLIAIIPFSMAMPSEKKKQQSNKWGQIGYFVSILGFLFQAGYFVTRWFASGHAPVSNLFEFITFFGMMLVFAFLIIYRIYKTNILAIFTMPIALLIIAYASMFPKEISPLIPALQSDWLKIHVTTAALGEGLLSISFVAGLIYLIRNVDQSKFNKMTFWLEFILYSLLSVVGFILISFSFNLMDYSTTFIWNDKNERMITVTYELPAIVSPDDSEVNSNNPSSLFETPSWMDGKNAAKNLNSLLWSFVAGSLLYILITMLCRKRIAAYIQPKLKHIDPELLDEISYRGVAIGFPVFTLGALVFAMIWAQEAWSRFWGWDPKEVWALITFLFYAAYLHLRLSRGWHGEKSAWLSVVGFLIIMFNLIAVNLVIAGLHSYA
jgi:cytochrome c-type biogenesis protein CcsB